MAPFRRSVKPRAVRAVLLAIPGLLAAFGLVATLAAFVFPATVPPASPSRSRVLVLSSVGRGWAVHQLLAQLLDSALDADVPAGVEMDYEYIDAARFGAAAVQRALSDFFRVKYRADPPDVVFAYGGAACEFMMEHGERTFPRTPVVYIVDFCSATKPHHRPHNFTGIHARLDFAPTIELALELQPQTKTVVVICGAGDWDRRYEDLARRDFARFAGRLNFTYLCGLPLPLLERRLVELPGRSIVFFAMMTQDTVGRAFSPTQVLERVDAVASVPIYSWFETFMEHGVMAVRTFDMDEMTDTAAAMIAHILHGGRPEDIPALERTPDQTRVNVDALRRWEVDERRVPAGSIIQSEDMVEWGRYRWYILGVLVLLSIQAGFIIALLAQRARRRRAELVAARTEAALRESHDRVQELARRLITAQEAERTRIARELHDDVNQQLAGLAISLSAVRRVLPEGFGELAGEVELLQRRTAAVVETIRDLSHELHPNTLRHTGLLPAVRRLCREIGSRHGVRVEFRGTPDMDDLPEDVTLTLYRVVQESLQNVVRHAAARRANVLIARDADGIQLRITDDGRGFKDGAASATGLGLISMEERVRLSGGQLTISSRPGHGTRIRVRIPSHQGATAVGSAGASSPLRVEFPGDARRDARTGASESVAPAISRTHGPRSPEPPA